MVKRLPYGISNYKTIALENYIYVDKTPYIEKLENYHSPFIFFLRPRRFGKSLFLSMLQNYYDIYETQKFNILFKDTYIGENQTKGKNSYYILNFDFTGVSTNKDELEQSFCNITKSAFDLFQDRYELKFNYLKEGNPANIFEDFLTKLITKLDDKPIYVIIDEYDHFANELLSFQFDLFKQSVSKTGFVRKWYEVLKKATKTNVKRIFATGVSPITLDSLTSGFNIADNITRVHKFHEMMGFNQDDVKHIIENTKDFEINDVEMHKLMDILKKNYNGYRFTENAKTKLFNSDMILYYLKTYVENQEGPSDLIDENITSDYGKLGKMFELRDRKSNMAVLKKILNEEEVITQMTKQFSMEKDFTQDDFKSLLFYLGLLTIDEPILDSVKLVTPNYVIKSLYFQYYAKKLNEEMDYEIDTSQIKEGLRQIALDGKNDIFIALVEKTLRKLSNRDYISFDEKYVKLIMLSYCMLSNVYMVKSEHEVEAGYIDIALLRREPIQPQYFAIFEVKYIKTSDYETQGEDKRAAIIEMKKAEATKQLLKYSTSEELVNLPNLKKWVIVFAGDSCVVNEEVF